MSPTRADPPPEGLPGRFRGLGAISARMAIIQHSPLHVNGAYREKPDTVARIRT